MDPTPAPQGIALKDIPAHIPLPDLFDRGDPSSSNEGIAHRLLLTDLLEMEELASALAGEPPDRVLTSQEFEALRQLPARAYLNVFPGFGDFAQYITNQTVWREASPKPSFAPVPLADSFPLFRMPEAAPTDGDKPLFSDAAIVVLREYVSAYHLDRLERQVGQDMWLRRGEGFSLLEALVQNQQMPDLNFLKRELVRIAETTSAAIQRYERVRIPLLGDMFQDNYYALVVIAHTLAVWDPSFRDQAKGYLMDILWSGRDKHKSLGPRLAAARALARLGDEEGFRGLEAIASNNFGRQSMSFDGVPTAAAITLYEVASPPIGDGKKDRRMGGVSALRDLATGNGYETDRRSAAVELAKRNEYLPLMYWLAGPYDMTIFTEETTLAQIRTSRFTTEYPPMLGYFQPLKVLSAKCLAAFGDRPWQARRLVVSILTHLKVPADKAVEEGDKIIRFVAEQPNRINLLSRLAQLAPAVTSVDQLLSKIPSV